MGGSIESRFPRSECDANLGGPVGDNGEGQLTDATAVAVTARTTAANNVTNNKDCGGLVLLTRHSS